MQASWTRTPLRLAVPVNRGLSCLNPTRSTFNSHLLGSSYLLPTPTPTQTRPSSSSSQWKLRQKSDPYARLRHVEGLKSRAAFKLLELDAKYCFFRRGQGQVVVDLGYAPGSWSQVAVECTAPNGTVLGIDIIPAQPPKGVSTIQGNFLSPGVQRMVKQVLVEGDKKRRAERKTRRKGREGVLEGEGVVEREGAEEGGDEIADRPSYIDLERMAAREDEAEIGSPVEPSSASSEPSASPSPSPSPDESTQPKEEADESTQPKEKAEEKPNLRLVDVVLSDMMMNTSGIYFKDHAGSMDLCHAALTFASETLKPGGSFVCKFYQGAEDKAFEKLLRQMFVRVHREKPDASRKESREAFFVARDRIGEVTLEDIEGQ
ncbi:FtsJ-like methyltransferase-domain-containing protein [Chaetomium tenue]|uniref:FtsJ-like methyltransferase-domain-containing protein n=1 Tax=Chaetomium tenue TaxID=1854479 RepID=A0ACB7NV31_9PEZI|nr:FtsJ-like methyltransferase-domain-containing protein [Chaetomium globosum]